MKVKDVMGKDVVTVSPETTYEEAARLLDGHKISGLPVVDKGGNLVGMLSEKDLFKALYPKYE
ncbi:MAG: CBS domain-containing protein, partial [Patescibacteria group bacterium]